MSVASPVPVHSPPRLSKPTRPARGTESQWQLFARKFARHRIAVFALAILGWLYGVALFAEFFAPHDPQWKNTAYLYAPPQPLRFSLAHGLYVFPLIPHQDPTTLQRSYSEDRTRPMRISLFVSADGVRWLGWVPLNRRLVGAEGGAPLYLLGADGYGRDLLSRLIHGSRISLSVGLVAIAATSVLGIVIGGISGYLGGRVDNFIQRGIEILNSLPHLPLYLGLSAALPRDLSVVQVYLAITGILSVLGWTGLARVVRGKILALREEEYAIAARLLGASHGRILFRHLLPGLTSHIIVSLTLAVPVMILNETALSFLGLGLREPVPSWGVMVRDCLNLQVVANYPWLFLPVLALILTVMAFNFLGDGLRDAADPYAT